MELDHATLVRFSPDSRSVLLSVKTDVFALQSYQNKPMFGCCFKD